ncbi:membrane-bound alkaline phosphatase precursor, putative [Pediculus humanus corporis]|uniref:alkaline phosphatase n=1 Tax=Pediculus humanus subsp. corporis TaxID=121224 RepID=E0VEB3_PEDHC|nr:membrane-bound alkaline phosphatase precursor, putative [Pediculus humanus corporis]EEB11719.1 membrane-bound alkaline phosphatase precursor, putative [Pediculus humanus corporis]
MNTNEAKNVILFLGDGMSIPTITASRIYKGQLNGKSGEDDFLSFEEFPFLGLAKTYCVDSQVADSACTSTAYLGGVKANEGTIGVSAKVKRMDCESANNVTNHVLSIATWAQKAGKSTGFVTTTRVTHASPAGLYAHTAEREWEDDVGVEKSGKNATTCPDIAQQLIFDKPGIDFNVIMGGGRRSFYPQEIVDATGIKGKRRDGKNLIESWEKDKIKRQASYAYITTRNHLLTLNPLPEYLLGLFSPSHMDFHLDAKLSEPLLEEMTSAAIKILQKNKNGFFLFVEGGKIDLAHHDNLAQKSLDETVEFSKAVSAAVRLTDEDDTLILVTADHAHVMSMSGYSKKGNNIFGFAGEGMDGLQYPTLSYANGPGYWKTDLNGKRLDIKKFNTDGISFRFPAMVPLPKETHGGDDVAVFARGPWSHLFSGTFEQNFIPHALGYASCTGKGLTVCHKRAWEQKSLLLK